MIKSRFILGFILIMLVSSLVSSNAFGKWGENKPTETEVVEETVKSNLIIASTLTTPPPGYRIVNSLGSVFAVQTDTVMYNELDTAKWFPAEMKKRTDTILTKATESVAASATVKGANAILNQHTDCKIMYSNFINGAFGPIHIISFTATVEGEAVVLEQIK